MNEGENVEEKCAYVPPGGTGNCGWPRKMHEGNSRIEDSEGWTHQFRPPSEASEPPGPARAARGVPRGRPMNEPTAYARMHATLGRRVMQGGSAEPRPMERRVVSDVRIKEFTAAMQGDEDMLERLRLYDPLFAMILEVGRQLGPAQ